jgi:hypothetical protein
MSDEAKQEEGLLAPHRWEQGGAIGALLKNRMALPSRVPNCPSAYVRPSPTMAEYRRCCAGSNRARAHVNSAVQ